MDAKVGQHVRLAQKSMDAAFRALALTDGDTRDLPLALARLAEVIAHAGEAAGYLAWDLRWKAGRPEDS